jgi:peptidoglycan hydrolase-like protein with peptidoglycan-binding domain
VRTNKNGNRYYTAGNRNYFENGEIWDIRTGKKVGISDAIAREYIHPLWTPEQIKADRAAKGIKDTTITVEQAEKNNRANQGKKTDNHYIGTNGNVNLYRKSASRAGVTNRNQVAALQRKLGLTADGVWGANTQAAWEKANGLTFTPSKNVSLELPVVTANNLAGISGNTSVVQPTKVEPVIQPRNYFNYTLPSYDLIAQNRLK